MYRVGIKGTLAQRLTNAEEIALTIFEPRAFLTNSLAGVISCDLRNSIYGLEAGEIVFFENHATRLERCYRGFDIFNLPAHLGVAARCFSCRCKQNEERVAGTVAKATGSLLYRLQA